MMKSKSGFLKFIPFWIWILLLIIGSGIFLRAYHFHDWLRFSPDEARDATIINSALNKKNALPLLGPQAGNTKFYLGPLYYQAEYVSALIFGNSPDKLAYPDLFFSILAIPLLFFFLRKYFSLKTALILDAFSSLSYFLIITSRFASNPNSIPFFVLLFLYALLEMLDKKNKQKSKWAILAGIAMGVGIQLHALLFLIMPAVALLVCIFLIKIKNLTWKNFTLVVVFFLLMNIGQIIYETTSPVSNIKQLFKGASSESSLGASLPRNIFLITSCQFQANAHIISSAENMEGCGDIFNLKKGDKNKYKNTPGGFPNGNFFILGTILVLFFSIGGYFLAIRYYKIHKQTNDLNKKYFLGLIGIYNLISFAVMLPVASQIAVHYYNILFFIPFVLLGLWFDFILEKQTKHSMLIIGGITCILLISNIFTLAQAANLYLKKNVSNVDNSILGEIIPMLNYMQNNTLQKNIIYIDGQKMYLKRFLKPFEYLLLIRNSEMKMIRPESNKSFPAGRIFFYIDSYKSKPYKIGEQIGGSTILNIKRFNQIIIYTLKKQ